MIGPQISQHARCAVVPLETSRAFLDEGWPRSAALHHNGVDQ